jgi:outer membrane protein assembly factor BamE
MANFRNLLPALLAAAALLGGCVYRPDIQQGNLLTMEDIRKVEVGMSRSQVRFLLGTPMVSDPFAPHRWDYIYRMQYGRDRAVITAHFVVWFEDDKVTRVETRDDPEPSRKAREAKRKKKDEGEAAAPAAASAPATTPASGNAPSPAPTTAPPAPAAPAPPGG